MSDNTHRLTLEHALPGENEYDEEMLSDAVCTLNEHYAKRGLEGAKRVGEYVLSTFFDDNVEHFRRRGRRHLTFRGLAVQEDLDLSYSFIWYAVGVVEQLEQLPAEIAEALPLSHHRLLLPVHDLRTKLRLAREAYQQNLSKRELEDLIRRVRAKQPKRRARGGRPPLPDFVKGLRQLQKSVTLATRQEITPACFEHYSTEDAKVLLANLFEQMSQLQDLAEDLRLTLEVLSQGDHEEEAAQAAK